MRSLNIELWLGGLGLGGALLAAGLALRPEPTPIAAEPMTSPLAEVAPAPAPAPTPIELAPTAPVFGDRPVVALAHAERDVDHAAIAEQKLADGELAAALDAHRKSLFSSEPTAARLLSVGRLARRLGELALAEQALLDAGVLDPKDPEVQIERARLFIDTGDLEAARFAAREALRLDEGRAEAWNVAGRIAMIDSEWERAEMALERAIELEPTRAIYRNNYGLLKIYQHDGAGAVDALEGAIELYGEDEAPYFVFNNLGLAHELTEDFAAAEEALREALARNPLYARAKLNLTRIEGAIAALERGDRPPLASVRGAPPPPYAADEIRDQDDDQGLAGALPE